MSNLNIHYLQHVPFEGLATIEEWAKSKGHSLTSTKFFENDPLPSLESFDLLIVMGGSMGVYDDDKYAWLKDEKAFIQKVINADKPVLGICLGSQLIASALGANVYPNKHKEIGWFPIKITEKGKENRFFNFLPEEFIVLHWHGDTFDLPEGALHIAESKACRNQAFVYKDKVIGLQFHFELDEYAINEMIENCEDDLVRAEFVQTSDIILNNTYLAEKNNKILHKILEELESMVPLKKS